MSDTVFETASLLLQLATMIIDDAQEDYPPLQGDQ